MENIGNSTTAKRWGSFLLLYLGYMVLFADRTVMNISLAYIGKDFHVGGSSIRSNRQCVFLRVYFNADTWGDT